MRGWKEVLIKDPGNLADRLHELAGYASIQELDARIKSKGLDSITVGGINVGFNEVDLGLSRSLVDYLFRRARERPPILQSDPSNSSWIPGKMFLSFSSSVNKSVYADVVDTEIVGHDENFLNGLATYIKMDGMDLFRESSSSLSLSNKWLTHFFENKIESFYESWAQDNVTLQESEKKPLPELKSSHFVKGDFFRGDPDFFSGFPNLLETITEAHARILEKSEVARVVSNVLLNVSETIITSNYHEEPARLVVPRCIIHSGFGLRVDKDILPKEDVTFCHVGVVDGPAALNRYLVETDDFVGNALTLLKERESMVSINEFSNRYVRAVLTPPVAGIMGHEICHDAESDGDEDEIHLWEDGKKIFSENATLWDDPTDEKLFGHTPCDDMGVKSVKKKIIGNGMITDCLYGFDQAGLKGKGVDGRIFGTQVRMTNTVWEPVNSGPRSLDELIEASRGEHPVIVVDDGVGGANYEDFNLITMDMTRCYHVPKGKGWDERVLIGFPQEPGATMTLQMDDQGFKEIDLLIGSKLPDVKVYDFGYCGKGSWFKTEWKPVGNIAPPIALTLKLIAKKDKGKVGWKPPMFPLKI